MTRSPAPDTARLLSIQKILEAADLAQQAKDWELVIWLVEIAFAALDLVPTLPCEHQMEGINPASGLAMTAY